MGKESNAEGFESRSFTEEVWLPLGSIIISIIGCPKGASSQGNQELREAWVLVAEAQTPKELPLLLTGTDRTNSKEGLRP